MAASPHTLDIGRLLDDGPFSGLQKTVIALAAMAIVLDGFDGQLIGFAIPLIIREWGVTKEAFAPAVAAGLIGMATGMAAAGWMADRIGRRLVLAFSVLVFGLATIAIGFAPNIAVIIVLRFIAGLGIGGALPCCSTLVAEYAPARSRTLAITVTIVCFPLGGMIAGLFAGWVLSTHGWRALFWIGGAVPAVYALVLFAVLPESPRFLAHRSERWPDLVKLLGRMKRHAPAGAVFSDAKESAAGSAHQKKGFGALLEPTYRRDTIGLCMAFFMVVLSLYSAFSWLPTMLANEGIPVAVASQGLTAYNLGGVVGALLCAVLINRFGSLWPILIACLLATLSALVMAGVDVKSNVSALIVGFGVHGLFVNAAQTSLYGLCAYVYATEVRATGTATALAVGRGGGILSSFIGAAVLTAGGAKGYLFLLAAGMFGAAIALVIVRRHIPPVSRRAMGEAAPVGGH